MLITFVQTVSQSKIKREQTRYSSIFCKVELFYNLISNDHRLKLFKIM